MVLGKLLTLKRPQRGAVVFLFRRGAQFTTLRTKLVEKLLCKLFDWNNERDHS